MTRILHQLARRLAVFATAVLAGSFSVSSARAQNQSNQRTYENRLVPIADPKPLLADYPQWVRPITEVARFEAPILVDDPDADLAVRAWRFSLQRPRHYRDAQPAAGKATALIVVHPWGIDDGQGWKTPTPAGCAIFCTPAQESTRGKHMSRRCSIR